MGETTDQIERQIEQKRNELSENFNELEQKVKSAVDWRTQFEEHPGTMLAIAFGGGALLAAMFGGTRSSSRNPDWDTSRRASERAATGRDYASSASTAAYKTSTTDAPRKPSHAWENLEALSGALLSVGLSRATNLINTYLPGFEREFARMKASKASERTDRGYSGGYSESPSERSWPNANAASTD
jgi:hypothetical protein